MIHITNKTLCCGCSACERACPKRCITMKSDAEGFLYPEVNQSECIECGLCEKVCHEQQPYDKREPLKTLAAINNDEPTRLASSSGGIFYLLAEKTLAEGGVVFGARWDEEWQVVIDYAETTVGVRAFMGSKYVQARVANAYSDALRFLKEGRKVLFSGSPCQIAGLHHFLRKEYDNLTTVDFLCHGTPSPKVWKMYLDEVVDAAHKITDCKFRNKADGWHKFNFHLDTECNGETRSLYCHHFENHFMKAFLTDVILRPACYDCRAKEGRSHSDITIADLWGAERIAPELDDDKGTGLVIVYTERGRQALDWNKVTTKEIKLADATRCNGGFYGIRAVHPRRKEFFDKLDTAPSVVGLINRCAVPPLKRRIKQKVKNIIKRCLRLLNINTIGGGKTLTLNKKQSSFPLPTSIPTLVGLPTYVSFRNKGRGWKTYMIEIRLREVK